MINIKKTLSNIEENNNNEGLAGSDNDFSAQKSGEDCEEIIKFKKLRDETFGKMDFYPELSKSIEYVGMHYAQYNMRQHFEIFINNGMLFTLGCIKTMETFKFCSTSTWKDLKDKTYHSNRNKRDGA
jgi:hypothetical protein